MNNLYIKPVVVKFNIEDLFRLTAAEECTVVCTYMYGYCAESDGWGTTYCPNWGKQQTNDDDDDND